MSGESNMHVLFEHASGYSAFKVREFEEESMFIAEVEECIRDYSRFTAVTQLVSFHPFKTAQSALENLNSVTEGILPDDLKSFIVKIGVKSLCLGVAESKLASSISEAFPKIKIKVGPLIQEICRGIRTHFYKMIKGLSAEAGGKAQLGLGHSYSRARVKFNVNRQDNMIIQGIALLDQLDKDVNTFSMRIREWYSYHFPELVKIVPDNYMYSRAVHVIKNRKELNEEKLEALTEITGDDAKAQAILDASKSSMGMDISPIDLINIESFAARVIKLAEYRMGLLSYLQSKMNTVAPNLTSLLGETVAARLISHAGSLTNLAKFPASTVQILGAEKALFRALKTRGKTPKYGLLFHSTFIGRAGTVHKGRISRFLANKCSIASRLDCFTEYPNSVFGEKLREQVEERLKFFESGEIPRKNVTVMKEALDESNCLTASMLLEANQTKKKDKKKKKKKGLEEEESTIFEESNTSSRKRKLTADDAEEEALETVTELVEKKEKKKKKKKSIALEPEEEDEGETVIQVKLEEETPKKKKKKAK